MKKFNEISMTVKFYRGDEYVMDFTFDSIYAATLVIRDWIIEDNCSVESKGIRLYKDCRFSPTDRCVNEFIDKVK